MVTECSELFLQSCARARSGSASRLWEGFGCILRYDGRTRVGFKPLERVSGISVITLVLLSHLNCL